MSSRIRHFAATLVGAAAVALPVASMACVLPPMDPVRIKQIMAKEIAYRLGMRTHQITLNAISQPQLHSPRGLSRDCRGIEGVHYSATFRIASVPLTPEPAAEPLRWPQYAREPTAAPLRRKRQSFLPGHGVFNGAQGRWPEYPTSARCVYEGVAVLLGYDYSSPVAVNFERRCW